MSVVVSAGYCENADKENQQFWQMLGPYPTTRKLHPVFQDYAHH